MWMAIVFGLSGCGSSSPGQSASATPQKEVTAQPVAAQPAPANERPIRYYERTRTEEPAWLAEMRDDPDPSVRIQALETWARNPEQTLDPLTYALVDPDESVRTRAQELLE